MPTERLLREALAALPVNITISDATDPDLPLMYVNAAFGRTTGYGLDEVIGRNCRFLQGPATDPAAIDRLRAALRDERPIDIEVLNYRKDGGPFWNHLSIAPVREEDGEVTAFLGIQRDVTEEHLTRRNELVRQRLEALGRLAGGVAHEINNLMQPTLLYADLIAADLPEDRAEAREFLGTIEQCARTARDIVKDVLAFARPSSEALEGRNLVPLLERVVDFTDSLLPSSVRLVYRPPAPGTAFKVLMRPSDLQKVLINLCVNAAHAMGNGGEIVVALSIEPGRAVIDVSDQGPGIPEDVLPHIFDPFFTTKPVGQGTGMGLSIVHSIVVALGGTVDVAATGPAGTTFRISLWSSTNQRSEEAS